MKNYINKVHPNSGLLSRNQRLVEPEKGDKRWRYSKEERLKIYSIIKDELDDVPNVALGLGSENPQLWDELGLNKIVYTRRCRVSIQRRKKIMNTHLSMSKETISSFVYQGCFFKQKGRNRMKNKLKIPIVAVTIIYRTDSGEDDSTTSYNDKIYNKEMLCKLDYVAHLYCIEIGDLWWPAYAKFLEAGLIQ